MNKKPSTMIVRRIEDQGDRVLLYAKDEPSETDLRWGEYHIIAPKGYAAKIGDAVQHEPFGVNFGFLVDAEDGNQ